MKTKSIPKTVVLSTTAQSILNNNPNRVSVIFTNLETIKVVLDIHNKVSATLGIILAEGGGFFNPKVAEDGDLPTREWFAIAESGTPSIRVIENIKIGEKEK